MMKVASFDLQSTRGEPRSGSPAWVASDYESDAARMGAERGRVALLLAFSPLIGKNVILSGAKNLKHMMEAGMAGGGCK